MNKILKAKIVERYGHQFRFARAIGAHESIVSAVIRNRRRLSPKTQEVWAEALKADPREIFIGEG